VAHVWWRPVLIRSSCVICYDNTDGLPPESRNKNDIISNTRFVGFFCSCGAFRRDVWFVERTNEAVRYDVGGLKEIRDKQLAGVPVARVVRTARRVRGRLRRRAPVSGRVLRRAKFLQELPLRVRKRTRYHRSGGRGRVRRVL